MLAVPFAAEAPRAEVLAVVRRNPIAIFANSRTGSLDHLSCRVASPTLTSEHHSFAVSKHRERHFFDRSSTQRPAQTRIVDDAPVAYINSVVSKADPRSDQMRSQWEIVGINNACRG